MLEISQHGFDSFPILKELADEINGNNISDNINNEIFHYSIKKHQCLKDLHVSVTQYFLQDRCIMLQNHRGIKDLLNMEYRSMDFNVKD